MPLDTGDVIGILGDNLRLRKSVLPLPTKVATKWTKVSACREAVRPCSTPG